MIYSAAYKLESRQKVYLEDDGSLQLYPYELGWIVYNPKFLISSLNMSRGSFLSHLRQVWK